MAIRLSGLGGSGGLPKLAPDLGFFESTENNRGTQKTLIIDPSGGLTTALSLTGKFAISGIGLQGLTAENLTVELTVDGVVIYNDTFVSNTALSILNASSGGQLLSSNTFADVRAITCDSSFLLRLQTATDTSVTVNYMVRPIL